MSNEPPDGLVTRLFITLIYPAWWRLTAWLWPRLFSGTLWPDPDKAGRVWGWEWVEAFRRECALSYLRAELERELSKRPQPRIIPLSEQLVTRMIRKAEEVSGLDCKPFHEPLSRFCILTGNVIVAMRRQVR